jgi:hypothetical protein
LVWPSRLLWPLFLGINPAQTFCIFSSQPLYCIKKKNFFTLIIIKYLFCSKRHKTESTHTKKHSKASKRRRSSVSAEDSYEAEPLAETGSHNHRKYGFWGFFTNLEDFRNSSGFGRFWEFFPDFGILSRLG